MNSPSQLAYCAEERCWMLSVMVLDALGNIGNGSDSQILGRIENLKYCTRGTHPDRFSLDLVLLILLLNAPNFAYW